MKKNYSLFFLLFVSSFLFAQNRTITGLVQDENSEPLIGATVLIEGTSQGTTTDFDGNFSLEVGAEQNILLFTYTGYTDQKIDITGLNMITVTLAEGVQLDEVIVVGYGVQHKESLVGSVSVVKSEDLKKQTVFQTSQALQGLTPGLTAIQSSGQPGSDDASLRVRGISSINASSSPLIIIDGIEGSLNGLDPNDIESMSVLKDAGAASIYGNRGSNGVIVVTTKRAKAGKAKVSLNTYFGFQSPTNQPEAVDAITYLETVGDEALLQQYKANPNDTDNFPNTDWVDLLFSESGTVQYHNISVSGGSEVARAKASFSYQNQDGNIPNFGHQRYQGRINTDFVLSSQINASVDLNFRRTENKSPVAGNGVNAAYRQPAIFPAIYSDGRYALPSTGGNPIAGVRNSGLSNSESNYFRALLKLEYMPIQDLTLSATYSPEHGESFNSWFAVRHPVYEAVDGPTVWISNGTNNLTQLNQSNDRGFTNNFYATARYNKEFGAHALTALAGYEVVKSTSKSIAASRFDYIIQDFEIINNGNAENDGNSGSADQNGLESLFGRINYSYNYKYLLEFNIRRDASSRFAPRNRVGVFPSVSVGWRITEEDFMSNQTLFDNLKFKASWGRLGNQSIGSSFPYTSLIAIGSSHFANGEIQQGAAQQVLSNPSISWETAEKLNFGLEFELLKNRLSGTIEYYDNQTKDLLGTQPIPSTTGLSAPTANVYSMKNTGLDLELQWRDKIGDLGYRIGGNFATVQNEVTNLNGEEELISGNSILRIGESAGSIFGYESVGIFQDQAQIDAAATQFGTLESGDIQYKDQNNDGLINGDDRVIIGNSFPSLTYSFNIGLDYKGFDLSISAIGVGSREVFLTRNLVQPLFNAGNIFEWHLTESWSPENTTARFPIIKPYAGGSNNSRTNSTYVFDASYLRIRNITLGYNISKKTFAQLPFSNLRLYASTQNPFTFNKDLPQGVDPLIPNNSQGNVYPIAVSYTFGINVDF